VAQASATNNSGSNATTKAANKAGAYGGSEVGALIGGAVGPPVIGGIVGNLVGERLGERAVGETGLDKKVGAARDKAGRVIGTENVDKLGEITLVALGYSDDETCLCCPCINRSQIMLIVMFTYSLFIWYRLGLAVSWESGCTNDVDVAIAPQMNSTSSIEDDEDDYSSISSDAASAATSAAVYPCEYGFEYMVVGAGVWAAFLPFHIFTLLGNCWRQCCCCLCDPLVCCSTICDLFKRYLCECGKFSLLALVWYSMCIFQVGWAASGLYWLVKFSYFDSSENGGNYDFFMENFPSAFGTFLKVTLASIVLDLFLAGSELVHKFRSYFSTPTTQPAPQNQEMQEIPTRQRQQLA